MEGDSVGRLSALVAESDAVIVEGRDSPDPVARRRVLEAFWAKARALSKLERYAECVGVWDELIAEFAEDPPGDDPLFVARMLVNKAAYQQRSGQDRAALVTLDQALANAQAGEGGAGGWLQAGTALSLKRDVLTNLRQLDAASAVDGEIIDRFGEAAEPELRRRVAFALAHRAYVSLRDDRVTEALDDSDELIRRFGREDDLAARERMAELLVSQARLLVRIGGPGVESAMAFAGIAAVGALDEGARVAARRLRLDRAPGVEQFWRLGAAAAEMSVSGLRVAVVVGDQRRRAAQTIAISREIRDRFALDEDPDHQQMVATATVLEATGLIQLGQVRAGFRRFEQLTGSGQEAVAEAFREAAGLSSGSSWLEELSAVANLAQRARTLGQGDTQIARIALEESMRPGAPGVPASRRARWIARLIGP